jgi:hypothetical protein
MKESHKNIALNKFQLIRDKVIPLSNHVQRIPTPVEIKVNISEFNNLLLQNQMLSKSR